MKTSELRRQCSGLTRNQTRFIFNQSVNYRLPNPMQPDQLNLVFAALADPTRRAMLARLSEGEANVSDLAQPFLKTMSLPAVTKHLKVLENAGLVSKGRNAQWRPCKLNAEPLHQAADWMEQYRIAWEDKLDRLDAYLKSKTQGPHHGRKKQN